MAAPDDTVLKNLIDSNIQDAAPGRVRPTKAAFVRYVLYQLIDWVKGAINGNLSTWYKVGTNNAPATNVDDVYRAGKVVVGRSSLDGSGAALQTDSFSIAGVPFANANAIYDPAATDFDGLTAVGTYTFGGGSGWLATGHGPGVTFPGAFTFGTLLVFRATAGNMVQMYIDNGDTSVFVRQKWQGNPWGAWVWSKQPADFTVTNILKFPNAMANRRIALYGADTNDHNYYGFGINNATLRYQIGDSASSHVFYAGTSPATSIELMRIMGSGNVGVGHSSPICRVHAAQDNPANGVVIAIENQHSVTGRNGVKFLFSQFGLAAWRIGSPGDVDAFVIEGWGGGTYPEYLRIDANGNMGINTAVPTSKLHIKAATGHQQLRLETAYTPTSSSDANGQTGQIAWDQNYIYVKVAGGWRRAGLNSW